MDWFIVDFPNVTRKKVSNYGGETRIVTLRKEKKKKGYPPFYSYGGKKSLWVPADHLWIHVLATLWNCLSEAGTCHAGSFWDVSMMNLALLLSHNLSLHLPVNSTLGISCHPCGVMLRGALRYLTPWSAFSNCVWRFVPNSLTLSWCLNWICLLGSYTHVYIIRCPTTGVPFCIHPILTF